MSIFVPNIHHFYEEPNLLRDEENWKVVLTEEEFAKRMFENEYIVRI